MKLLSILTVVGIVFGFAQEDVNAKTKGEEYQVRFKSQYSITNNSKTLIKATGTTVFLNTENNDYSTIMDERISIDNGIYGVSENSLYGNRNISYAIEPILPTEKKSLTYESIVKTNTIDYEFEPNTSQMGYPSEVSKFVQSTNKIEVENPIIQTKAKELKDALSIEQQSDPYNLIQDTFEYVQLNMRYTFDNRARNKGAVFAAQNLVGNCEDYSSLMTALLRANDIPARTVAGFRINPTMLSITDMNLLGTSTYTKHMWVEVYVEGYGWMAFDPTVSSASRGSIPVLAENGSKFSVSAYLPLKTVYMNTFAQLTQLYIKEGIEQPSVEHTFHSTNSPVAFKVDVLAKRVGFSTLDELYAYEKSIGPKRTAIKVTTPIAYSTEPVQMKANYYLSTRKYEEATDVTWSSDNEEVATITTEGLVSFTGKEGKVTFIVKGDLLSTSTTITVSKKMLIPERLAYVKEGQQLSAYLLVNGKVKEDTTVTWASSNPAVATVDQDGKVSYTGKPGSFKITATNGKHTYTISSSVSATLSIYGNTAYTETPVQLSSELIYNSRVKEKPSVTWTSSNADVAKITEDGLLTFTGKVGQAVIQVTDGTYKASKTLSVTATLRVKERLVYSLTPTPLTTELVYNSGLKKTVPVVWSSTNPAVATVDSTGKVTFTGTVGKVNIEATSGTFKASVPVSVTATLMVSGNMAYSPTPSQLSTQLVYNSGVKLNPNVTWSSSNSNVATVDNNGLLTFTGSLGYTDIQVTSGSFKAVKRVSVSGSVIVTGSLSYSTAPVQLDAYFQYSTRHKITPPITWRSTNPSIATVDQTGKVTFTGAKGTVSIEASAMGAKSVKSIRVR